MAPPIGIDLGTTYSCVAAFYNGKIKIIPNEQGNPTTPSYVAFKDDKRLIGEAAKNQMAMNALNTIYDSKRLIGRPFDDEKVQQDLESWSFKVIRNADGNPEIEVESDNETVHFPPEQISSMILENLKQVAEKFLREKVTEAVITVPAYFNQTQREATKLAGQIAGLEVLEIINEPTAAALAYGLEQNKKGFQIVLIFDLGGGTFDVSIIKIINGDTFEVKAVAGDDHLGGEDFDKILVDHFAQEFQRKNGADIRKNPRSLARLRKECERAKRTLSSTEEASIEIECLYDGVDFSSTITRARFELLCQDLFESTIEPIEKALADAEMDKSEIDEVVMVGGSTRIPRIQQLVSDFFDRDNINYTINPDEAVAHGAAVRAAILSGEDFGHVQNVKLFDVVPLSLGISVGRECEMSVVVKRNSKIPCEVRKPFSTVYDNQIKVSIRVYEGERQMVEDNHFLGEFQLTGITPAPRGVTEIDVVFTVNTDGILTVSAQETGKDNVHKELSIDKKQNRLTATDVQRMIDDATKYAKQDEAHKQRLLARTALEDYIAKCQQAILNKELSKNLTDPDRQKIREKCTDELSYLNQANIAKNVLDQRYKDLKKYMDGYDWKI